MIYYFIKFLTGGNSEVGFVPMITNPTLNVTYLAVTVLVAFGILCFNLQNGLERVTKYMMIILLVLMLALAVHSCLLPGAAEGLKFYLVPDLSAITGDVIVGAMNQAFFTLSLGIGSMAIFGSYIGKDRALLGESLNVILLDTFVAVVAGLIIFPACTTYNEQVNAGPSLLFDTMAKVFNNMPGGRWWGALFFLFMVFAALSTVLAVCENIIACVRELTGWKRPFACLVCGAVIFVLALTTALGYSTFSGFGSVCGRLGLARFLGFPCQHQPSAARFFGGGAVLLQQALRLGLGKPQGRSQRRQGSQGQGLDAPGVYLCGAGRRYPLVYLRHGYL